MIEPTIGITNELIRLTMSGHITWTRTEIPEDKHNYMRGFTGSNSRLRYVEYRTEVLGKGILFAEMDEEPYWVSVGGTIIARIGDNYNEYVTSPVRSLWKSIKGTQDQVDPLSIAQHEFLVRLREVGKSA